MINYFHPCGDRVEKNSLDVAHACRRRRLKWHRSSSFINIRAPTEDRDSVEKKLFYEELHALYGSSPKNDVKNILGDANAKIGTENEFRQIVGKSSLHDLSNDNGKRLIYFAAYHNTVLTSTMFQHKNIHKITQRSSDGSTCNQIDHLLVDSRHKSHILDVRTYHGANLDSDHFLLMAKVRARISNFQKSHRKCVEKFDCGRFKDKALKLKFQEQLENKYKEINNTFIEDDMLRRWNERLNSLLNSGNGDYEALTGSTETQSQCVVELPSLEEIIEAINKLKENKAPGHDAIPSELQKNPGKETSKKVYDLIQAIWEQELLAFADDIDVIARAPTALIPAFLSLEKEALGRGLKMNENKIKYMTCIKSCFINSPLQLKSIVLKLLTASLIFRFRDKQKKRLYYWNPKENYNG
ncbi:craniofacial development protein 2 [Trichonephila clavipes]|nr:craniofacial development protein 2 [Trichonephila clavipes]